MYQVQVTSYITQQRQDASQGLVKIWDPTTSESPGLTLHTSSKFWLVSSVHILYLYLSIILDWLWRQGLEQDQNQF